VKTLWCGGRNFQNRGLIETWMRALLRPGDIVVHGAARGADSIAAQIAENMGLQVVAYPADWDAHGKAAGPIRNQRMLDENLDITLVVAFPGIGKGTFDMMRRAREKGIKVIDGTSPSAIERELAKTPVG
jgi:hypothetical protein